MENNLKTLLFLPEDEIIRQGDFGNRMYFIGAGAVDVFLVTEKIKRRKDDDNPDKDPNEPAQTEKKEERIQRLKEGLYFGEVALITNLKRTATVRAVDYLTLAYIERPNFEEMRKEFPQVYLSFKKKISIYNDEDFKFRRLMIKNVPYFKNLSDEIVEDLVYLLRPHRYDQMTTIIKYGDITDKIHFLKQGEILVTIPTKQNIHNSETKFEVLNPGSCFCAFSAFADDIQQLVNFKSKSSCVIETISVGELEVLE